MWYFRNVVAAAAAAAAAATAAATAVALTGIYGLFVRSNRTVSCHRAIDCLCLSLL